jgi:hypothetical protein
VLLPPELPTVIVPGLKLTPVLGVAGCVTVGVTGVSVIVVVTVAVVTVAELLERLIV